MKKRILAALLALGCALLVFTGCGSKKDTTPKNYTQIIHDAREAEDNDYYMIFSPAEDGKFTAQYGYSASYPADAASLSAMMVQSYGIAIVKPAEGKTQEVVDAMDAYIQNQQQTMEHYLEDQYQIAAAAKVATVPTGEVVMVCCENSDAVMNAIKTALAA